MSVFDWRGASSVFAGAQEFAGRALDGMSPQAAYYWRKKAGLTGSRDKPVRGWRKTKPDHSANCDRASNQNH